MGYECKTSMVLKCVHMPITLNFKIQSIFEYILSRNFNNALVFVCVEKLPDVDCLIINENTIDTYSSEIEKAS